MREMYVSPAIEVVEYEVEDVITLSVFGTDGDNTFSEDIWFN